MLGYIEEIIVKVLFANKIRADYRIGAPANVTYFFYLIFVDEISKK
jgi:hypothetical protein